MNDNVNDNTSNDDGLNAEEFSQYMNKYNEYFSHNRINENADITFLDEPTPPSDELITNLFLTDEDKKVVLNVKDYEFKKLGKPNSIRTMEGTQWSLSKLVWIRDEGIIITFDIVKVPEDGEVTPTVWDEEAMENVIDISHEEVVEENYHELLRLAIEEEDYLEASRLRDWSRDFHKLMDVLLPKMKEAMEVEDYDQLDVYLNDITKYRKTL